MDTSTFFYAGYMALWLIPTIYLFKLDRRATKMEDELRKKNPAG